MTHDQLLLTIILSSLWICSVAIAYALGVRRGLKAALQGINEAFDNARRRR